MARKRIGDLLQNHRFWLMDISPNLGIPLFVLNPLLGFQSISGIGSQLNMETISPGNSTWDVHTPSGGSADAVTLTRGVSIYDSSFHSWMRRARLGLSKPARDLLVIQFTGKRVVAEEGPNFTLGPIEIGHRGIPGKAWVLWHCVPTSYKGPDLSADSHEVSVTELGIQPRAIEELSLGVRERW